MMQASYSMADSKWQYDIILIYEIDLTTLQHDNMIISWQLHDKIEFSPPCRRGWSRQTLLQAGWYIHQEMKHCFQRDSLREVIEPFEIEVSMYGEAKRTELVDVSRCLYIQNSAEYGAEEFAIHSMVQGNLHFYLVSESWLSFSVINFHQKWKSNHGETKLVWSGQIKISSGCSFLLTSLDQVSKIGQNHRCQQTDDLAIHV